MDTTSNEGEFGASQRYEEPRLDYSKPEYKDLWALVAFYVHVGIIFIVGIACWASYSPADSDSDSDFNSDTDSEVSWDVDDINFGGIIAALIVACIVGALFGLLWLQCIKKFPEIIIKVMLFVMIAVWALLAVVALGTGSGMAVLYIIFLLLNCLYTWCIWHRIPFAGACLAISSQIVQSYAGVIWLSFAAVFMVFLWYVIWGTAITGYALTAAEFNRIITFLLLVSLFWGAQVCMNVSHTTTCGVAATWYFNSGKLDNPSRKAFKRTMTTSFGSVAFGSLLVAVIQALRAMVKSQRDRLACLVDCLLGCLERIMQYFNKYAFCQCAIYGVDYLSAGKRTWDIFVERGFQQLINDDLSGLALFCGCFLGAVVSCAAAVGVSVSIFTHDDDVYYHYLLGFMGFVLGYCVVAVILKVVASGVVAVFVCFAEDPAALKMNRPEAFNRLRGTGHDVIDGIVSAEGLDGTGTGTGQTTGYPPQQQQVYVQQQVVAPQQVVYVQGAPPMQQQPVQYQQEAPYYSQQQQQPPQYGQQPPPAY